MFRAVVEAVEEAVVNALLRAETMTGRDGHKAEAIPIGVLPGLPTMDPDRPGLGGGR